MHVKKQYVLFVPGLGGESVVFQLAAYSWRRFGFTPLIHDVGWKDGEEQFGPKLEKLLSRIDSLHASGGTISLVGTSAGGSAVLNAFSHESRKIHRVVNICGRLRAGHHVFPSLEIASRSSVSFRKSVERLEQIEPRLSKAERQKILTVQALYDETVPLSTIPIHGANNIRILTIEHNLSISLAMTIYARMIATFLRT